MWKRSRIALYFATVGVLLPSVADAQEEGCRTRLTRTNLVTCALASSLPVQSEEKGREALQGRRAAVSPILPTNPVLSLTGARRGASAIEPTAINWSATLAQEFEIAGQRGSRLKAVDAELEAQSKRVVLTKRDAALTAWTTFFEVLGAREQQQLLGRLLVTSQRMALVSRARAEKGVGSTLEADIADAASLKVLQAKVTADAALSSASANLDLLLGRSAVDGTLVVDGDLTPLPIPDAASSPNPNVVARPETQLVDAERRANLARAEAFRRSRISNPTLSIFAQNDGYNERVLGLGLSIPIPLPGLGRTYVGEIAESEALAGRSAIDRTRVEKELRSDIVKALAEYDSHRIVVNSITPERVKRAEDTLRELGTEIEAGRLGVREALLAQQQLIDLLNINITERRALCLASVDLARALGLPLEGGAR